MYVRDEKTIVSPRCDALQLRIQELEWVKSAQKQIPNLPKGKLKESLVSDIKDILDDQTPGKIQVIEILESLKTELQGFDFNVKSLANKRLTPDMASNLSAIAGNVERNIDSSIHSLRHTSF